MPVIGDTGRSGEDSPESLEPSVHMGPEAVEVSPRRMRTGSATGQPPGCSRFIRRRPQASPSDREVTPEHCNSAGVGVARADEISAAIESALGSGRPPAVEIDAEDHGRRARLVRTTGIGQSKTGATLV